MGTDSVPEKLENFDTLTRLSVREDFIDFCRRESFITYLLYYTIINNRVKGT